MLKKILVVALVAVCSVDMAVADIVCVDSSYCVVNFATTKDRVTIAPSGAGETFAATGITIQVYLKNCNGAPLVGMPRQEILIYNSRLCICPGGNVADVATDVNGMTTFSGTIRGGGTVESLTILADGIALCTIPVKTNSPDDFWASPCYVDASDLAGFATVLGIPAAYNIRYDYNESGGPTIDASDLASFAGYLGGACQ